MRPTTSLLSPWLTLRLPASLCASVNIRLRRIVYCQEMNQQACCIQLLLSPCSVSSKHTSQYASVSHTNPRLRLRNVCADAAVHAKKGLNWPIMALLERVLNVVACKHVDDVTALAAPLQCFVHSGFGKCCLLCCHLLSLLCCSHACLSSSDNRCCCVLSAPSVPLCNCHRT